MGALIKSALGYDGLVVDTLPFVPSGSVLVVEYASFVSVKCEGVRWFDCSRRPKTLHLLKRNKIQQKETPD
jgi:hypothetical protein